MSTRGYSKAIAPFVEQWQAGIAPIVDSGYYKDLGRAERYIDKRLGDVWRAILHVAPDDNLMKTLGLSPAMKLVVHLFALGVLGFESNKYKAPHIQNFIPTGDPNAPFRCRAIPKRDIARLIGKGPSAVDRAIGALRGSQGACEAIFANRLAVPVFTETGIMLDVMKSLQISLGFELYEYQHGKMVAEDQRINQSVTLLKQREHCDAGIRAQTGSMPTFAVVGEATNDTKKSAS